MLWATSKDLGFPNRSSREVDPEDCVNTEKSMGRNSKLLRDIMRESG